MTSRLFHTIVLCGAALGVMPTGCGSNSDDDKGSERESKDRCKLDDGTCEEHCTTLADGTCVDPCFVDTETCASECIQQDGSCGWPPTK